VPTAALKPKPCRERKTFGRNVARLRAAADLTQEQFAERTGLTARYVQQIESGDNFPSLPKLAVFCDFLAFSWNDLFADVIGRQKPGRAAKGSPR
jgi:transcriptional regulator with XRE-family HTH domain